MHSTKITIFSMCTGIAVIMACGTGHTIYAQAEDVIIPDEDTTVVVDTEDIEEAVEQFQEKYLENYSETDDASALTDMIEVLRQNPMDINNATQRDLEQVPGISPILAKNIVEYRKNEKFQTTRDLLKVPSMSREIFIDIRDFVTVQQKTAVKRYGGQFRQRTKRAIEESGNFTGNKYEGNIYQLYNRMTVTYKPYWNDDPNQLIRAGMLIEKDPGEKRWDDHRVGYVEFRNMPAIKKAVIGNYQLEFGQALAMWSGSGLSKSSETIESVKKRPRSVNAYQYASENSAYFGGAVEWDFSKLNLFKNIDLATFYSYSNYDASKNRNGSINSILIDGYHRTPTEKEKKNYLLETMGGFNMAYRFGSSSVGITYYASQYNRLFVISDTTRSGNEFTGHKNNILSMNYDWFYGIINIFGELAKDKDNSVAGNAGLQAQWDKFEMVWYYRNYSKNFQNLHGYAFGEQNGKTQNEEGIYTGVKFKPNRKTLIQSYFDIFRYPWRNYEVPKPVYGNDFLIQWEQKWFRSFQSLVRFKQERKDVSYTAFDELGRQTQVVNPAQTRRLRYQVEQSISSQIRIRTRFEHSWYKIAEKPGSAESGFLIYQDIRVKPYKPLTLYGRVSVFDTKSFNTAIYEYENDVEGVFSNTALYSKGVRWYLLVNYRFYQQLGFAIKFWEMYKDGVTEIGSGLDAVKGNVLRKITLTLNAQF